MKAIEKSIPNKMDLYLIGDTHYPRGSRNAFLKVVNEIKRNKFAKVIGFGDWVEAIIATDPRYHPEETATLAQQGRNMMNMVSSQWEMFENDIEPIADKIWGLHSGNHGGNIVKRYSINELSRICKRLGFDYLDDGIAYWKLSYKNNVITLKTSHGLGGGFMTGTAYNNLDRRSNYFADIDLIACGHTHKLGVNVSVPPLSFDNGILKDKPQYQCHTGSFLTNYQKDITSYGERKEYSPLPIGYVKVFINKGKIVNVSPIPV